MGPLQDVRILDLSRLLPGPFCTRMFADMGADVIKIEEPVKGDYARDFVPRRGDFACWFMEVNRNKRSVAMDLKQEEDKAVFLELAKTADVVVESFRPGVMKKLGIDFETVRKINPKIVYCAITGYGTKGPLVKQADHDIGYQSLAGLVSLSGKRYGSPAIPGACPSWRRCTMRKKRGKGRRSAFPCSIPVWPWCQVSAQPISETGLSICGETTG